jgi:hypothetical protein
VAAAAVVLAIGGSASLLRAAVVGIACGVVAILVVVILMANAAGRQLAGQLAYFRNQLARGQEELQRVTDQVMRGERPPLPAPVASPGRSASGDPFRLLAYDLGRVQQGAGKAILQVADRTHGRSDQRVEIFMNLARRMQSLVHREIEMLDSLEAQVEDPDLLKGLFTVDHLATRMRRQSESLAVLGGSVSRRQWTRHVTMHEVLRAAVAEVEQYSRVKIVPPVEGLVRGPAVADIIHLIAELVENATKFSAPRTQTLLRAQQVTAGIAIEIEDRGLGLLATDQQRMNALLAEPGRIDLEELLRDGRIGLYVVSTLSHRHEIRVQLQGNIYGGTSAIVVLPWALLNEGAEREIGQAGGGSRSSGPMHAGEPASALEARPGAEPVRPAAEPARRGAEPARHSADTPAPPAWPGAEPARHGADPGRHSTDWGADPTRELVTAGGTPANGMTASAGGMPPNGPAASRGEQPSSDGRPPLPRRQAQASLASQLRDRPGGNGPGNGPASARRSDPIQDHTPGLMADFLRGVNLSEDEETWPDADGTTR